MMLNSHGESERRFKDALQAEKFELLHNVKKENSKLDKDLSTDLGKHVRCLPEDKTF